MRLARYILEHKIALLFVFVLLVVQACCELFIPLYTSQIVDVGIQQAGIESPVCDTLSGETYSYIVAQEGTDLVEKSYDCDTRMGKIESSAIAIKIDNADTQNLAFQSPDTIEDFDGGSYTLNDFGRNHIDELAAQISVPLIHAHGGEVLPTDSEALIEQKAIEAARLEYKQLGYDLADIQMDYLIMTGCKMIALAALMMCVAIVMFYVTNLTGVRIGRDLRRRLFERAVWFSDAEIGQFTTASLITRGTNDIQIIQNVSIMMQRMILYSPIVAIGGIIMVARTNSSMAWTICLAIVVLLCICFGLIAFTMPKFKMMQKLIDKVNLTAREILTGLPVVRAFGRELFEEDRFNRASGELMSTQLFTGRAMSLMIPLLTLVMNGVSVLIVWVGSKYVDLGTIQTGDLIAFITYSMVIIFSFLMIGLIAIVLPRANVAAERVDAVIASPLSIQDKQQTRDAEISTEQGISVTFDNVCFAFPESEKNTLDPVTFEVAPRKSVAIIGSTGCGKTTILRLIERFADVDGGSVKLNGIDVRDLSLAKLRSLIAYVPQKTFLFSGTIESNVSYGNSDIDNEALNQALEVAQAATFVASKEEGVASPINQEGTNVSGGQRQRLAIARALAYDAPLLLFDDSFSALDYKTDSALRAALKTHAKDKTIIIVAQRIASVMDCDSIIVLDEGRVAGIGTNEQLLKTCEAYREIALSQLSEEELGLGVK